jgi:hypothetical protein
MKVLVQGLKNASGVNFSIRRGKTYNMEADIARTLIRDGIVAEPFKVKKLEEPVAEKLINEVKPKVFAPKAKADKEVIKPKGKKK